MKSFYELITESLNVQLTDLLNLIEIINSGNPLIARDWLMDRNLLTEKLNDLFEVKNELDLFNLDEQLLKLSENSNFPNLKQELKNVFAEEIRKDFHCFIVFGQGWYIYFACFSTSSNKTLLKINIDDDGVSSNVEWIDDFHDIKQIFPNLYKFITEYILIQSCAKIAQLIMNMNFYRINNT